jgi:hypothetical protein
MESSVTRRLSTDLEIRVVTAPYFIATKSLVAEIRAEPVELRAYIQAEIKRLLVAAGFLDALPGYLLPDAASQSRIGIVLSRLKDLASSRARS